jgi:hypothetical protein
VNDAYSLQWVGSSTLYFTSGDGCSLHAYNATTGKEIGELNMASGQILGTAVTSGNAVATSSNNSILVVNGDLKTDHEIAIVGGFELLGPIAVSDEGLVFVAVRNTDSNATSIQIISLVTQEQFHQHITGDAIRAMQMGRDGKLLLTNNGIFFVKDNRRYNQPIITACDEQTEELSHQEQSDDVLVSQSYVENKVALLQDVQCRLADVELLIDLESKTTKNRIATTLATERRGNDIELNEEQSKLEALKRSKEAAKQECHRALEDAKMSFDVEVQSNKKENKDKLLRQVRQFSNNYIFILTTNSNINAIVG